MGTDEPPSSGSRSHGLLPLHLSLLFSFWRKAPSGLCNPAEQVLAACGFPGTRMRLSAVETLQPLSQKLGQSQAEQKAAQPPLLALAWHQQSH